MAKDTKELKEIRQMFKEFARIEKKGFLIVEKLSKEHWKSKNEEFGFKEGDIRFMKNHKPRNFSKQEDQYSYCETEIY